MNKQIASEDPRVVVSVEESGNETPCGRKGFSPTKLLVAKLENTNIEVGRARLCMPNQQSGNGAQGFFTTEEISISAPNMAMVFTALVEKARELLPKNDIVVLHDGQIPKEVELSEKFSDKLYILKPMAIFA